MKIEFPQAKRHFFPLTLLLFFDNHSSKNYGRDILN